MENGKWEIIDYNLIQAWTHNNSVSNRNLQILFEKLLFLLQIYYICTIYLYNNLYNELSNNEHDNE